MKAEELIQDLSHELKPVKRIPAPIVSILSWVLISALCLSIGVLVIGLRHDFAKTLLSLRFLAETTALLIAGVTAGSAALLLSIPGENATLAKRALIVCIAIWLVSFITTLLLHTGDIQYTLLVGTGGFTCTRTVLLFALVPGLSLLAFIRMAAPMHSYLTGFLLLISAGLIGAGCLQFTCSNDNFAHLLVFHILPVIILGLIGVVIAKHILGWNSRLVEEKRKH